MHADHVQLAFENHDVGFLDLDTASADGFAFPTLKAQTGLELFFDKIFVEGFFVRNNAHAVRGEGAIGAFR
jgi:hypothetical protein